MYVFLLIINEITFIVFFKKIIIIIIIIIIILLLDELFKTPLTVKTAYLKGGKKENKMTMLTMEMGNI